ncbi:MAG: ubiquinol-cytochrome c reductase iron-sulfur subunit [Ilumatobacteraceae bacterium]
MSAAAIIAIAVGVVVVLAALTFLTLARRSDVRGAGALSGETRRRDRTARQTKPTTAVVEPAPTARDVEAQGTLARRGTAIEPVREVAVAPWSPPDPEAIGVSRRMFFNRATVTLTSAGLGAFAAAGFVGFLWPTAQGGFGQEVNVGKLDDIRDSLRTGTGFFYAPAARTWITEYPPDAIPKARAVYEANIVAGIESAGIVALYQKCPHLGCRVPDCPTSGWFECPCHGSQYNRVGEKKAGPAPRGMDRFPISVAGNGDVTVDTGTIVPGPPIGTNTTGQEAEGPHCITGGGDH